MHAVRMRAALKKIIKESVLVCLGLLIMLCIVFEGKHRYCLGFSTYEATRFISDLKMLEHTFEGYAKWHNVFTSKLT